MLAIYQALARIALDEFEEIIASTALVGGTPASPNKLRLIFTDASFLDIWISSDGDYSYHWEQRRQRDKIYRWDNAPHYPQIGTFPAHFHDGEESAVSASDLSSTPETALRDVLEFVRAHLR